MKKKVKRETRAKGRGQYHIQWSEPSDIWPKGGWSLYRIDGDEIARRIIFGDYDIEKGYPKGPVKWRHSWPGYIGMYETWEEVGKAIEKDAAEVMTFVSYE